MPRDPERGFTLVEVLVALIVTSLILAIVMNAALQARTRAVSAEARQEAVILARSLIAGRTAAPFDRAPRRGRQAGLRWTLSETGVAADTSGLLLLAEIEVSVRDSRGVQLAALTARKIKAVPL